MVHLKFFISEDLAGLNYVLDEVQSLYTSTAEQALERIKERNDDLAFPVSIFNDDILVGFLVLDFGADKFDITDNPNSVLLRSLSINPEFQGKGIGKAAMLLTDNFVKEHFNTCDEIVLAVNQNNSAAYEIYLKTGYSYDGKIREGRSGPQYLMSKKL
ncbi:GNAT family N-acetyltransferase [Chryseobacterium camelliae]|uniref:GNAT family N-acetyltransferase n=1 Tax=Chryseobacterium camelliae TaxID=1265445 RepID=A0ABY7QJT0_9FLAO|nr:GNAT family N-acetyltransferase [Chryseobacterium camelliae]WBV59940.1 GNAT family N-acetyltransferase [Chryseobacterium camelliae]